MSVVELVTVGAIVLTSVVVVWRQFARTAGSEKGSCKGCGDSCACVIKTVKDSQSSGTQKK